MNPNTYVILERAVEEGVLRGYRRAFKHGEYLTSVMLPTEEEMVDAITDAVMLSVSEVFDFSHQSGDSYQ
jgi:hypothetical protein